MNLGPLSRLTLRILMDIGCICVAFLFTTGIGLNPGQDWMSSILSHDSYLGVFVGLWCIITFDQRLYVSRRGESLSAILFSVVRTYIIVLILGGFILALYNGAGYSREFFVIFAISTLVIFLASIIVARPWVLRIRRRYNSCRVLFVGADEHALRLAHTFQEDINHNYHIVGFLDANPVPSSAMEQYGISYLGAIEEINRYLVDNMVDVVYVALPLGQHYEEVERIARLCETIGVTVRLAGDIFPMPMESTDISSIGDIPLISMMTRPNYLSNFHFERLLEIGTSLLLLIALSPLFAVVAVLMKLESAGPIFQSQRHPWNKGSQIDGLSFRLTQWAKEGEPLAESTKPTRMARVLLSCGLEELPQLINVLLGKGSYTGNSTTHEGSKSIEKNKKPASSSGKPKQYMPTILLALLDAMCILSAYLIAIRTTSLSPVLANLHLIGYLPFFAVLLLAWYAAAVEYRLWRWRTVEPILSEAFALLKAMGNAAIVCGFLIAVLIPSVQSMRNFLTLFCILSFVFVLIFRFAARFASRVIYRAGYRIRKVVIIGANERTEQLLGAIGNEARFGYNVAGIVESDPTRVDRARDYATPYLGEIDKLEEVLLQHSIHEVFITLPVRSQFDTIEQVIEVCQRAGISTHMVGNLLPLDIAKSRTVFIGDISLISLSSRSEVYSWLAIKRIIDFLASTLLIIAFSPLFLVIATFIKLESKGSIFFVQDRIGQSHRNFKMIKFRSMVPNAEELKSELMHLNEADGPTFKIANDPRITALGNFLRKYSLDELPQLFNVWMGEMSLVGPRPLMPHEVEKFKWYERRRLSVTPGMTGLWQVSGRNNVNFREWVEMDLEYIDTWSFWQDIVILSKTFGAVISGRGAN